MLALLAAAYGKSVSPSVLGNIERAAKAWREGDDCLAHIHLAQTGLHPLHDARAAAHRLLLADAAMCAGASFRDVLKALRLDVRYIDAVDKYGPDQPRVPKGSGRISGEWTRVLSWLGGLGAPELVELGSYALRVLGPVGGAAAVFGLLFVPSPNGVHTEGEVAGVFRAAVLMRIRTKGCFTSLMMPATAGKVLSQRMSTATRYATTRGGSSAVCCFPMAVF